MNKVALFFTPVDPPTLAMEQVISILLKKYLNVFVVPFASYREGMTSLIHMRTMFSHSFSACTRSPMTVHRVQVLCDIMVIDDSVNNIDRLLTTLESFYEMYTKQEVDIFVDTVDVPLLFEDNKSTNSSMLNTLSSFITLLLERNNSVYFISHKKKEHENFVLQADINTLRSCDALSLLDEKVVRHDVLSRILGNTVYRYAYDNGLYNLG